MTFAANRHRCLVSMAAVCLLSTLPGADAEARKRSKRTTDKATVRASPKADIADRLARILSAAPGKPKALACLVDLDSGKTVMKLNGDGPAWPASVAKMFTTAAILRTLPEDHRLSTRLMVSKLAKGAKKKRVATRLALIGGGDPTLTLADFDTLVTAVEKAGIGRVGTLIIDSTLFDDSLPRGYDEKNSDAAYRAPIDALQVNGSVIAVTVRPAKKRGARPQVSITPSSRAIVVVNQAKTVKGKRDGLNIRTLGNGRRTEVRVRGVIGQRRKRRVVVRRRVNNARLFAGETFRARLEARAISVNKTHYGATPKGLVALHTLHSKPLIDVVRTTNKTSHNGYAETLFKLVGVERVGRPGTAVKAEAGVQQALAGLDIDWRRVSLGNGSGLYHANRVTACQVVTLLRGMYGDRKVGKTWRKSLAIGGVEGTLRHRLKSASTRGRIFAKTGTLDDVTALAGYALGKRRKFAFALFFNQVRGAARTYRRVHDRFLTTLLGADRTAKDNNKKRTDGKRSQARSDAPKARNKPAKAANQATKDSKKRADKPSVTGADKRQQGTKKVKGTSGPSRSGKKRKAIGGEQV